MAIAALCGSRSFLAGGASGSGAASSARASTIPGPKLAVSQPGGVRHVDCSSDLKTRAICAAPYRLTRFLKPWNDTQRAATPAVVATANDVPLPRSTEKSKPPSEPRSTRARQTDAPGAVISTASPRDDPAHSSSSKVLAATAIVSSKGAGNTTTPT